MICVGLATAYAWSVGVETRSGQLLEEAFLYVQGFESRARLCGAEKTGGLDTLSMLMLDYDYNGEVFEFDRAFYAHQLEEQKWRVSFSIEDLGPKIMAVFIDVHGNKSHLCDVYPLKRCQRFVS